MTSAQLIAVEGIDGSGKSTLCEGVRAALSRDGHEAIVVRPLAFEPSVIRLIRSGARFAARAGESSHEDVVGDCLTYAMLGTIEADVLPALGNGVTVICDRYRWSHSANQRFFGNDLENFTRALAALPAPDLVVHLDIDEAEALHRIERRGKGRGVIDGRSALGGVRQALRTSLAVDAPSGRFVELDAAAAPGTLVDAVLGCLRGESD